MATPTVINGFDCPPATHTGWRTRDGLSGFLGKFRTERGHVWYDEVYVGHDSTYGATVEATAITNTPSDYWTDLAAADVAALDP